MCLGMHARSGTGDMSRSNGNRRQLGVLPILFNAADLPVLSRHPELVSLLGRFLLLVPILELELVFFPLLLRNPLLVCAVVTSRTSKTTTQTSERVGEKKTDGQKERIRIEPQAQSLDSHIPPSSRTRVCARAQKGTETET